MICKNCGTENPEKANFCKQCGKRMDGKIICPSCKTENSEDSIFCYNCGNRVAGNTQQIVEQKSEQVVVSGGTNAAVAQTADELEKRSGNRRRNLRNARCVRRACLYFFVGDPR